MSRSVSLFLQSREAMFNRRVPMEPVDMSVNLWILEEKIKLVGNTDEFVYAFKGAIAWQGRPVPAVLEFDKNQGLRGTTTDPFGDPLYSLTVAQAANALGSTNPPHGSKDAAVLYYLLALHPDARVLVWFE